MKSTNIGIANLVVSSKLKDSYFNDKLIEESKKLTADFLDVVKNSPILQLEFKVFNNLENKVIENDLAATRYIDNNVKLFEIYTISEIEAEREKIKPFLPENIQINDNTRVNLYNAIDTLITESLNVPDRVDVDNIHESFEVVLNHIKTPKKQSLTEELDIKSINDNVIEIAINKFNEKYDSLNEDDKNIVKKLIKSNDEEKQKLFEEYVTEDLNVLENLQTSNENAVVKEKAANIIKKIKEMKYDKSTIVDDIIRLHELKKELL